MFFLPAAPHFAEKLRRYPDIAGDLVLGYPLGYQGIFVEELKISFFRCLRDGGIETLLQDA